MNIIIDIGHPAHVHMFHFFAKEMQQKGHNVLVTCRDKEFEISLLESYNIPYVNIGKKPKSFWGKLFAQFIFEYKVFKIARSFQADIFLSHGSIIAAHVSSLLGKPAIAFEDTFNMEQVRIYAPCTKLILTSDYDNPLKYKKILKYPGYHELLYLHPRRFQPDKHILKELGLTESDKYVILRFVAWQATHDKGHKGISIDNKRRIIKEFSQYAYIYISSESSLPADLEPYRFPLHPSKMHDAEAFASLIFGESATMVSEGVVLGTPGVYLDNTGRLYCQEQENKYGMCYNFSESESDQELAINKGLEILKESSSDTYCQRHSIMMNDKIDVTGWLVWLVENWPSSISEWRKNYSIIMNDFK